MATAGRDTAATGAISWDPFDWSLHENSHPVWKRMREEAPLYRNDEYDFYALTRFQDVLDVLVDWKTYTSDDGPILELIKSSSMSEYAKALECVNPPSHTVRRKMLSRAFHTSRHREDRGSRARPHREGPRRSGGFGRVRLRRRLRRAGAGDGDRVHARDARVGHPGDPPSDRLQLVLADGDPDNRSTFDDAADRLGEYFMEHVRERRKRPGDDLTSALVTMEFTDEQGVTRQLTDMEACQSVHILSAAGNETTARFTGWACAALAQFPDQRAKLVDAPTLIANGVEEVLRCESPTMSLARVATRAVHFHDQTVPAGSTIVVIQAAANRDHREFPAPDTFDVTRRIDRTLTFGFGIHLGMGALHARMEGRIVVEEMLKRFPAWDVDWANAEIVHLGSAIRGYRKLPITLP